MTNLGLIFPFDVQPWKQAIRVDARNPFKTEATKVTASAEKLFVAFMLKEATLLVSLHLFTKSIQQLPIHRSQSGS